ncbi:hypothetical protein [Paenibacillus mangrovi]|nr:hypothetical protein [Paenibacillus mangrovi]
MMNEQKTIPEQAGMVFIRLISVKMLPAAYSQKSATSPTLSL